LVAVVKAEQPTQPITSGEVSTVLWAVAVAVAVVHKARELLELVVEQQPISVLP